MDTHSNLESEDMIFVSNPEDAGLFPKDDLVHKYPN